jgi:serine/threonine protein kinase
MPISLNHPSLVPILHVGRNDEAGYFYSIMEAADDEISGQKIDPNTYSPRTLSKDLQRREKLSVAECLSLGLALTTALEFLHQKQLIHRDIKPSNIIFINGVPKLADIGLVTDISRKGEEATQVGTKWYMAPEGPGTPAADLYSLGKVIYVASMGKGADEFPLLPTQLDERTHRDELIQLNRIILKACEEEPHKRYQSAAEMHAQLLRLESRLRPRRG